jgi:hypothetical protein
MIKYYFSKFMMWLGYRKVWYFPSNKGIPMANFYSWEYHPKLEKRIYRENDPALREEAK